MSNWFWVFLAIAVFGLLWHGYLGLLLFRKGKRLQSVGEPIAKKVEKFNAAANSKPIVEKPVLAIDTPIETTINRRLKLVQQRNRAKAARERRLIDNLKKIDPTERRFIRVRKRA